MYSYCEAVLFQDKKGFSRVIPVSHSLTDNKKTISHVSRLLCNETHLVAPASRPAPSNDQRRGRFVVPVVSKAHLSDINAF